MQQWLVGDLVPTHARLLELFGRQMLANAFRRPAVEAERTTLLFLQASRYRPNENRKERPRCCELVPEQQPNVDLAQDG